jgi:hypothetical protein
MTGRAEPSLAELRSDLNKRLVSVEASTSQFTKRFDRENMPGRVNSAVGNAVSSTGLKASTKGHTTGAGAMKATTHDNSAGFSSIDFNAPDVTKANAPKLSNSLGLDIECVAIPYVPYFDNPHQI